MPVDAALVLRAASDISTTATTAAIDVEGGSKAEFHAQWSGVSGTSPTVDISFEVSVDGGSTYKSILKTRQFVETDIPTTPNTRFHIARPVWIPQNTQADAWGGSLRRTKARIVSTIGGSGTPTFVAYEAWLDLDADGSTPSREQL